MGRAARMQAVPGVRGQSADLAHHLARRTVSRSSTGRQDVTEQRISKRLRYEVLRRDNHACRYCGATAPDVKLTVDHVVPVALGGTHEPSNLVTACSDCNSGKSSSNPDQSMVEDVSADALRWAHALEEAAELLLMNHRRRKELRDQFRQAWERWTYKDWTRGGQPTPLDLPNNWANSVDTILAAGLPIEILCECVDIAMGRKGVDDVFRYLCGVAWSKVGELRAIASVRIEAEGQD